MAHQCIKYRLTEQGTIPEFICSHPESLSGMYAVDTGTHQFPQECLMVGISEKDATGDFEVVATKENLLAYLTSIGASWQAIRETPPTQENVVPFNYAAAADYIWGKLNALNAV
jgi:hypothetical protein